MAIGNCTFTNIPDNIDLSFVFKVTFTKYCPPVFLAEPLTSETFPDTSLFKDFTIIFTGIPFVILVISPSETIAVTCILDAPSMLTNGIPGFAISPSLIKVLVTSPENGAVIFEYENCAITSFRICFAPAKPAFAIS